MFRSLDQIDSVTLERYRRSPDAFIQECLVSPYDNKPYRLIEAEREFIRHAFEFDADGRLLRPLWVYGAIKKSRKSELAGLLVTTVIVLFAGKFGEAFIVSNDLQQSIDRVLTACKRVIEASPLLRSEFTATADKLTLTTTQSVIRAIPCDPSGVAGAHPVISVFDEFRTATDRVERMYHELIPVPSRRFSARLIVSHAGFDEGLLYNLYQRGLQQPEVSENLHVGDGLAMHWSHTPLHDWQSSKWLLEMRRELPASDYLRMGENRFVPSSSEFITGGMWDDITTLPSPPLSNPMMPVFIGVDGSFKRDSTAIAVVSGEKDFIKLHYHKIFEPTANNPIDFALVEQTLLDLKKKYPLCKIVFDSNQLAYLMQRVKGRGLTVEEFVQSGPNISAMTQCLYDLVKYKRLAVYPDQRLRTAITHAIVEEKSDGHRLIRNRDQKDHVDVVIALAMAAYRCTQRHTSSVNLAHKYRAFDPNFRDEDLPPEPAAPQPGPVTADGNWWRSMPRSQQSISADDRLRDLYRGIYFALKGF